MRTVTSYAETLNDSATAKSGRAPRHHETSRATGAEDNTLGVADGTATVEVTATDPDGLSATQRMDVTVEKPSRAPTSPVRTRLEADGR